MPNQSSLKLTPNEVVNMITENQMSIFDVMEGVLTYVRSNSHPNQENIKLIVSGLEHCDYPGTAVLALFLNIGLNAGQKLGLDF